MNILVGSYEPAHSFSTGLPSVYIELAHVSGK